MAGDLDLDLLLLDSNPEFLLLEDRALFVLLGKGGIDLSLEYSLDLKLPGLLVDLGWECDLALSSLSGVLDMDLTLLEK